MDRTDTGSHAGKIKGLEVRLYLRGDLVASTALGISELEVADGDLLEVECTPIYQA